MSIDYTEKGFEENIEDFLVNINGYRKRRLEGQALDSFKKYAIDVEILFEFLESTQAKELEKLKSVYKSLYKERIIERINKELNKRGLIDCLRHGIKDYGVHLKLAYNKPANSLNYTLLNLYSKNIFTVSRQVHYSEKNNNSIDMLIMLNGLPIIVLELKNPLTGQTVDDAKLQFMHDRDPKELLFQFKKRTIVFFAVDTEEVYMTTKLDGKDTIFLPFNKGNNGGRGNPEVEGNYKTHYLWEEVFQKDSLLDILFNFVFIKKEQIKDSTGEIVEERENLIFPRYHQLDVVRNLEYDTKINGTGKNYLIQHSAGSGKTNSISWLAHRLAKLHDDENKPIFHSVIVITDRRVLDKQLQDAIYQIEHKAGMVAKIEKNSNQLAEAIKNGTRIIVTTLQKFPFIIDKIKDVEERNYAIIIDEAHSSQTGRSAAALRVVLSAKSLEEAEELDSQEEDDMEDRINKEIAKLGPHNNISYYAFTATPKAKTLEFFGTQGIDGKYYPYHVYSMRQAIEEGFILDVLKNYVTYKTFYKIAKKIEDDPDVPARKAARAIAKYVSLHPHNIAQKTEIIIEHFRQVTRHKIGGRAKAMVVTSSRLHAVRYKQAFDKYINEKGYKDLKALVAFSGTVIDDGIEYTEEGINGIREKELPEKFKADEYKILLVAEKYQTGFDEPLLHTMYVDKKLEGIKAVQTLSRLNRTCKGKNDTFILDFVNDPEDIRKAFQTFYEVTELECATDPNILYDLQNELNAMQVYTDEEILEVVKLELDKKIKSSKGQEKLNSILDKAVSRFKSLTKEQQEQFKSAAAKYIRTYSFILQIGPFADSELHKLYVYLNFLLRKLPKADSIKLDLADEIALEYYRNEKTFDGSISLVKEGEAVLQPTSFGKTIREEEKVKLSSIIEKLNQRFGTDFTETDRLTIDQLEQDSMNNEDIILSVNSNDFDNFKLDYTKTFMDILINRREENEKLFLKIIMEEDFRNVIIDYLAKKVYDQLRAKSV
ncbi:type I restriction endonuclease subunit R [Caloramator australicus]|uniref:Type I restriction-modification system,restriction subunit R n=1 Tax=Caloramator australicus RC3 TaxID=857293 RepID=I7K5E1_9CLOT|nr:type I restriction endonuclease [Caloramator australicus]CCJ32774.1 Type I restriction-modification system,restriction subunit R [Caloramator australicus RC3]